jgi:tRNA U34 5-methylaminomethyl-2-thiouridine-forming methyltransferase MnmC
MKREVITTRDGSNTIAIPEMQVMYHSIHGAILESMHVYIESGLRYALEKFSDTPLRVFEMGFGSGLNALLTAIEARKEERAVHYYSVEAFPLVPEEVSALNYGNTLHEQALFELLHRAPWNEPVIVSPVFLLEKLQTTLANCTLDLPVHIIYYDAFAPAAQPEMWTQAVFEKLYGMLVPGGILTTYCSKGDVRRAMQAAGFTVTKLPGPRGKREMLRAERPTLAPGP